MVMANQRRMLTGNEGHQAELMFKRGMEIEQIAEELGKYPDTVRDYLSGGNRPEPSRTGREGKERREAAEAAAQKAAEAAEARKARAAKKAAEE